MQVERATAEAQAAVDEGRLRTQRRRNRLLLALLVLAVAAGVVALVQRQTAQHQATAALAGAQREAGLAQFNKTFQTLRSQGWAEERKDFPNGACVIVTPPASAKGMPISSACFAEAKGMAPNEVTVVVPLSNGPDPRPPIVVAARSAGPNAVAVCDQLRAVDKRRLTGMLGRLSPVDLREVEQGVRRILEL